MFDGLRDTCVLVHGLSLSECASWVQASGSILALIVAACVVVLAHRPQQKAKRRDEWAAQTRFLDGFVQLVCAVSKMAGKISQRESDGVGSGVDERRTMLAELQSLEAALLRIDLTRFDHLDEIEDWLAADTFVRKLAFAVRAVDARSDAAEFSAGDGQRELRFSRSELLDVARDAQKKLAPRVVRLRGVIDGRGGPVARAMKPPADASN
ncbi:hypothetical protein J2W27_004651 [Variovorax boronicumulans]|uniref:hypothetical protein n=1 Tax=Variovorax boronicumulans TaxID=436515 RepID=UPI0027874A4C|nr:hypothetical protein [Variovorax boronicumulans]MDP9912525.1 hypothetical protein [Variovorax boronicumulans]